MRGFWGPRFRRERNIKIILTVKKYKNTGKMKFAS
jgi:hypothetical protein